MKHKSIIAGAVLMAALALPGAARAEMVRGYANASTDVLAGPRNDFPMVAHVATGTNVDILGCTASYAWCDIAWNGNRGWVDARYLDSMHDNRRAPVMDSYVRQNMPIEVFEQRSYWDSNYHDRPFYTERRWWALPQP
jgi:uncharacterized protein YraI